MDKDAIAFLDDESVKEPEVPEEPQAETEELPEQNEAKTETKEPEAEEQTGEKEEVGPPSTEPPEPVESPVQQAPLTALLDEREKRQEAQRKAEEADRRIAEMQAHLRQLQQPEQEAPDWDLDPQAAAQHQRMTVEQQFQARLMQMSKFQAEREFGPETVNEAVAYFDKHPAASQQFKNHPSPFHAAVEFYERQKVAEEIGTDPEGYKTKLREELMAELRAEMTQNAPQTSKPTAPPPSVASAPAAGREAIAQGGGFDTLFPD